MLIEIVQQASNKVVKEATLEQAIEYANHFQVNLVDSEGNRTLFVPEDHQQGDAAFAAPEATEGQAAEESSEG